MTCFEMPANDGQRTARTVRLVRYDGSGTLDVSIGRPGRQARAAARLTARNARRLAEALNAAATEIETEADDARAWPNV
jgi:hypothetical protein